MNIEDCKIIRAKRKTVTLEITREGHLILKVPNIASESYIQELLEKKKAWINKSLDKVRQNKKSYPKKEFVNGEEFLYLGQPYKLRITDSNNKSLDFNGEFLLPRALIPAAHNLFINWYKEKAREKITERVKVYSQMSGLKYNKINITNSQKRFGSCSQKGNLSFTWRLIMAPLKIIDYIVVHEIAHLEVKNHSKKFWEKVKIMLPDYEVSKKWLKENGNLLRLS